MRLIALGRYLRCFDKVYGVNLLFLFNPRPAGGGGRLNAPPLRFFEDSEKTAARSAAGFSPTLPPIFSATFVKISPQGHVRSGHQVRSSDPTTK